MLLGGSEMLVVRYGGFQREYVLERENDLGLCRVSGNLGPILSE